MKYITLSDMMRSIRNGLHKIPHDIDFVIGIPRSGMICASVISEFLNVPLIDIDSFVSGAQPTGGSRMKYHRDFGHDKKKVLIVDDTINRGNSITRSRNKLEPLKDNYDFVFMAVYQEGPCTDIDLFLEDVREYTNGFTNIVLYEWNILQHHKRTMSEFMFDYDGVFCIDPPDERDTEKYQNYIRNAVPLFLPTTRIGEVVTYRLESNREPSERWLSENGVAYKMFTMFPANTWTERAKSGISPAEFKSDVYMSRPWAKLFIESNDKQAREIHLKTGKPVYCVSTNTMYA